MNRTFRLKTSHRSLKKPEVKKLDRQDRERVPPPKKRKKDGKR